MSNNPFKKATKKSAKLRLAIFGPAGSGKTYTALRLAAGLGGPIALVDTERGSASKYADRFDFDVLEPAKTDIPAYVAAFAAAGMAGYPVLIVDSLSHAWQELLAEVDKLARAKYSGNTWSAWSEGTPKQRHLVDAILAYPGHIIVTMRTKTEWTTGTDERGKTKPVRVGLAPEQGKGIEYEFDLLMEITADHLATVIKDRTGRFQDRTIDKPDEALGRELAAWLAEGVPPAPAPARAAASTTTPAPAPANSGGNGKNDKSKEPNASTRFWTQARELGVSREDGKALVEEFGGDFDAALAILNRDSAKRPEPVNDPDETVSRLVQFMIAKPEEWRNADPSAKARGLLVEKLNEAFDGDEAKRHAFLATATGEASTSRLSKAWVMALLDYILVGGDGENRYHLVDGAKAELWAVWQQAAEMEDATVPQGPLPEEEQLAF